MSQSLSSLLARAQVWNGSAWVKAPGDAANGLDVDVTRSVLPTGASTETTLAGVKTGTDKIPASPAQEHSTAASPHSARLTDGGTYLGSTAQRLHVDDGGSSLSVDDNAGSLTVDSAQLPAALAAGGGIKVEGVAGGVAQPVSLATNTPDVTDRDARLLGRAKLLDSASAVIDPALKGQLPAALVGGRLSVDASGVAVPITDNAGSITVDGTVTVTPPTLTKGAQGATGFSVQDLRDAGRNPTNWFHAAPIITTTAEVMQTLTGYKGGVAVTATATPAVVTAGKTYRVERITVTYIAATVIGGALLRLRANLSGVAVVGSPLVWATYVGIPAVFTAGAAMTYVFEFPDGLEFAAGTGIALGVIGGGAVPTTGTITGYVMAAIEGYEY